MVRFAISLLSLSAGFLLLAFASGADKADQACVSIAVAGLNVIVTDATTGVRVCDAPVTAEDGDFVTTLAPVGGDETDCAFAGAWERPGTYTVRAGGAWLPASVTSSRPVSSSP